MQFQNQLNNQNTNEETEIIVIDNGFRPYPLIYHFEDFFWTGSGDGSSNNDNTVTVTKHWPISTDSIDNEIKPTVYLTSTVTSTVIITRTSDITDKIETNNENTTNCVHNNCDEPTVTTTTVVTPILPINPTRTSDWENVSTTTKPKTSTDDSWWSSTTPIDSITTLTDDANEVNTITIIIDTHRYQVPDRRYWIITILEDRNRTTNITTHHVLPPLDVLENRLAILYHIAFYRQQQKHLGIQNGRSKRSLINKYDDSSYNHGSNSDTTSTSRLSELYIKNRSLEKINVQIHNISTNIDNNDLELVYSVRVGGQPVPAKTAAADMRLVTNDEVIKQFGSYTVKTKAEPYLKDETKPLGLARYENTWLFIGSAIGILIILLIILILIIFGIQYRINNKTKHNVTQSKSIITDDNDNDDDNDTIDKRTRSHTIQSVLRMEDAEVQTCARITNYVPTATKTFHKPHRNIHVATSSSSESPSSSDTACSISPSPTSRRRYNQWKEPGGGHNIGYEQDGRQTINQHQTIDDYDGGYKEVVDATNIVAIRKASDVRSAHSYLSMPSVKNFPRGSIPEPLSRVLEPVSIRHLDDGMITPIESPMKSSPTLIRHGSMQEAEDPGVIGPLVWNQHCQKLNQVIQDKEATNNEAPNVGRMKKRFQELLDDAFSLFGSRSVSPEDQPARPPPQITSTRAHSAYPRLSTANDTIEPKIQQRPKTSVPVRKSQSSTIASADYIEPKCAWTGSSGAPSPLVRSGGRPLSAGPFHRPTLAPHICPVRILPEGRLNASDAAVPVIEAIKTELRKCGQTSTSQHK